jgi:hypothetical protein
MRLLRMIGDQSLRNLDTELLKLNAVVKPANSF